jgi:hypothetical protein
MKLSVKAIAIWGITAFAPSHCLSQEQPQQDPSQITREQWQARIKAARERSETIRLERKFFAPRPPTAVELAEAASRRVLEDDSLRPGDIVSTNQGFFRFQGAPDQERTPNDFVRIR